MCRLETAVTRLRKLMSKVFALSCKKGVVVRWAGEGRGRGIKLRREFRIWKIWNVGTLSITGNESRRYISLRNIVGSSSSGSNVTGIVVNICKRFSALSFVLALLNFSSLRIFSYRIYICIYVYVAVEFLGLELNSVEFGYLYDLY